MPARGGRVGGGSRGGGFRAPRVSGGGSRGVRVNIGNRAARTPSSASDVNASTPQHVHHHRPWFRNRQSGTWGIGWRIIGILIGLFFFGMCGCVALGLIVQQLGL